MTARCRACRRPLRDPISRAAGYGPVCLRARRTPIVWISPTPEQLLLPGCGELPASRPRQRRRGPVHDLPDIANYQPTEDTVTHLDSCPADTHPEPGVCGCDAIAAEQARDAAQETAERAELDDLTQPDCPAGLLPLGSDPVEPCVVRGRHDAHETAAGERWTASAEDVTP